MIREMAIVLCLVAQTTQAQQELSVNLGSGHRGLMFTQFVPKGAGEKWNRFGFTCNLKPGFPVDAAFLEADPNMRVLLMETLEPEYLKTFDSRIWAGWTSRGLYSFGPDAAFSGNTLYRIEDGHIRIYPGRAQAEARKTYGLLPNQKFLGSFGGRVFFWIKDQPQEIFFREGGKLFRFKLDKWVTGPMGMSNGEPKGDLALFASSKPRGWIHFTPRVLDWHVLSLKDAEQIQ